VVPGPVVIPGDHASSTLYKMIQPTGPWPGGNRMPLGGPYLSTADLNTIASWIDGLPKQGSSNVGGAGSSGNGVNGTGSAGPTGGSSSSGTTVSFKNDVQPIFQQHCAACHIAIQSGGLDLSSYQGLMKGGNVVPGPVVKAGDPQHSILYQITSSNGPWPGGNRMPLGGPYLASSQLQTIENWIAQGAKDN
jgi:mono/diheme cytochrome c family protein